MSESDVRDEVRERYAAAAVAVAATGGDALAVVDAEQCCPPTAPAGDSCCPSDTEVGPAFGSALYSTQEQGDLPVAAVAASLGCGNPMAVAELRAGERVLDLGSGGGIDVLLSAKRVGPSGFAYGVDMTDEMLALARANATTADATNVEFLKGTIEDVPLPGAAVDVVISNCVINLSTDKPAVLGEMFRVLTPGGRIGISDVVAEDHLTVPMRAELGSYVGCVAGALSRSEYLEGLATAGFADPQVTFTHQVAPGMHGAIVRATKPVQCCSHSERQSCCEPSVEADCCTGQDASGGCACQPDPATTDTTRTGSSDAVKTIEVFEPALCCNTGVCGEDVDQGLVTFSADVDWATRNGSQVVRRNLASEPLAFAQNDAVRTFLQLSGSAGLPLVLVDGVTVLTSAYPDRAQLARWTGVSTDVASHPAGAQPLHFIDSDDSGCCSSDDGDATGCC